MLCLIPKKRKDLTKLESWRPLSVLNTDYKILAKVLAKRLKVGLREIINPDQIGYMKSRFYGENIRLIADMIDFCKLASLPRSNLKDYRPVSGLCFMSKLVERVVAKQLMSHINKNKLDNPHQSAYKPGHSAETALLSIKNEVHLSLAHGEPMALVLLDLSAAFDTIDHNILLGYLKSWFGVGGTVLKWFASYLSDRCQSIKIGSTLSELSKLIYGIPQGSVLGPLLFLLYTTPLRKIIRILNSTSMRMTHSYTSISPTRMPLLLLPS